MKKYTKFNIRVALQEEIDMCNAVIASQSHYADEAIKAKRIAETAIKMPTKKAVKYILTANK